MRTRLSSFRFGRSLRTLAAAAAGLAAVALSSAPAGAQPVFEGVETATTAGSMSPISVDVPAGVQAGDLLIAIWGNGINPSTEIPSSFTPVPGFGDPILGGFNQAVCPLPDIRCQLLVAYKIADGTETQVDFSYVGNLGNTRAQVGAVLRYSNVSSADPIGPAAKASGVGTPVTAPAINTTEANSLVLRIGLVGSEQSAPSEPLTAGPATQRFSLTVGGNEADVVVAMAGSDAVQAAAGNTGTASWTTTEEEWVAGTIAIHDASVTVNADLSVSKTDNETTVIPGDTITYQIVVANSAASDDVTGASVDDNFPSDLSCEWTCTPAGGAVCATGTVAGDIADTVDLPANSSATYSAVCEVSADPLTTLLSNTATVTPPPGVIDDNNANNDATDTTAINQPPEATCADVEVAADGSCQANASIDDGSSDPDGDAITLAQSPAGPYPLGDTLVTLTVTDPYGLSDSCMATVTVVDQTAPVIQCNAPATIVPPDATISFIATASDNCSVASLAVTAFGCSKTLKNGKVIDKGESCVVGFDGATLTIDDVGGVGTTISWTVEATDGSGNTATKECSVEVVNPGHN